MVLLSQHHSLLQTSLIFGIQVRFQDTCASVTTQLSPDEKERMLGGGIFAFECSVSKESTGG